MEAREGNQDLLRETMDTKVIARELTKIARELVSARSRVAISTLNMQSIVSDYERQAYDRLAKKECEQFAKEVSKAVAANRESGGATPYHARTKRVAMGMGGKDYFAQSDLVTPTWQLRLFFSQDGWDCYAVIMRGNKKLDSYTAEFPQEIGRIIARKADEMGLQ